MQIRKNLVREVMVRQDFSVFLYCNYFVRWKNNNFRACRWLNFRL